MDTEEWAVISTTVDARLALMTRLFDYRQLFDDPQNADLKEAAGISLGDLNIYMEQLAESESLAGKPVGKGPFAKQTFDAALLQLAKANEDDFDNALQTHIELRQTRERYSEVAETLMQDATRIEQDSREIVAEVGQGVQQLAKSSGELDTLTAANLNRSRRQQDETGQISTAEILGMIERLQMQAHNAAKTMRERSEMAQSTVRKGEQTGASLNNIVESVASIEGMNQQIASAAAEQQQTADGRRQTAEDISQTLARINSDGEKVVTDSDRISDTARSLSQLSGQLEKLVSQFRT